MQTDVWLPAVTGLLGLGIGAALQYYSARVLERRRHFEELRSRSYVDFVRAVAALAIGRREQSHAIVGDALADSTDAKIRVAMYGSAAVVNSLAAFCRTDQHLASSVTAESFMNLTAAMRVDTTGTARSEISDRALRTILFEK